MKSPIVRRANAAMRMKVPGRSLTLLSTVATLGGSFAVLCFFRSSFTRAPSNAVVSDQSYSGDDSSFGGGSESSTGRLVKRELTRSRGVDGDRLQIVSDVVLAIIIDTT